MLASCIFRYHNQSRLMLKCFKCGSGKLLPALSHVTSNFSSFNKVQNNGKFLLCKRSYSDEKSPSEIPQLMNFPMIIWPSIFKSIRNFILTTFIIRPYMDVDFDIAEFIKGSKRAVQVTQTERPYIWACARVSDSFEQVIARRYKKLEWPSHQRRASQFAQSDFTDVALWQRANRDQLWRHLLFLSLPGKR